MPPLSIVVKSSSISIAEEAKLIIVGGYGAEGVSAAMKVKIGEN